MNSSAGVRIPVSIARKSPAACLLRRGYPMVLLMRKANGASIEDLALRLGIKGALKKPMTVNPIHCPMKF